MNVIISRAKGAEAKTCDMYCSHYDSKLELQFIIIIIILKFPFTAVVFAYFNVLYYVKPKHLKPVAYTVKT